MDTLPYRGYWPTTEWRTCEPEDVGLQRGPLVQMQAEIGAHLPGLHALLIVHQGYLAFERYFHGFHQHSLHSISSATKSVISALVGVALAQGYFNSLDQHLLEFFPEIAEQEEDPRKRAITLHHMLSLQTGFTEQYPHEFWLDPVRRSLLCPMAEPPGMRFFYDNLSVDILSGLLMRVTGMRAALFADRTLFATLGIWRDGTTRFAWKHEETGPHSWHEDGLWDEQDGYPWKVNRQGGNTGSFGAHMTARDMAKLGFLYLNNGYWDGIQVIRPDYVLASTSKQSDGGAPVNANYGYLWWREQAGGSHAFFASGFGGKHIYVVPERDLVVVTTASSQQAQRDREQHTKIRALVSRYILPALSFSSSIA